MGRDYLKLDRREQIAIADQVMSERKTRNRMLGLSAFVYWCVLVDGVVVALSPDWSLGASVFGLALYLATAACAAFLLDRGLRESAVEIEFRA